MDNQGSTGAPHCCCCGVLIKRNPRLGDRDQHYCGKAGCQRARKAAWHQRRYADSAAFRQAVKKRVRISRRTRRAPERSEHPPDGTGVSGADGGVRQLHAQVQEMRLLLSGMASHTTGIVNGIDLAACLERYTERGRMLGPAEA